MTKLDEVITFTNEQGEEEACSIENATIIPTSKGKCTVKADEFPEELCFREVSQSPSQHIQNIVEQMKIRYGINVEMVLYMVHIFCNSFNNVKFIKRDDEDYSYFIDNRDLVSYELKYLREFNGMTDVIMYSKTRDLTFKGTSFYTLDLEGNVLVCSLMNRNWKQGTGMNNYVLLMLAGFREQGVTFTNKNINEITDKLIKERRKPKTLERTRNNGVENR